MCDADADVADDRALDVRVCVGPTEIGGPAAPGWMRDDRVGAMTLRLIGAGWARTGTMTIKAALGILGMRAFHMQDVFQHLEYASLFTEALDDPEFDWERIFAGYDAAIDQPTQVFWRELCRFYPEAKVLLSVRDPDDWFESYRATVYAPTAHGWPGDPDGRWNEMARRVLRERAYRGEPHDRATVIDTVERHNDEVRQTIPEDRLLVYRVTQGWEPLCDFLAVPVPEVAFPHLNRREDWR